MDTITVSVILPIYNGGWCVKSAIMSVLRQSFSEFELILINDGSTDNTKDVVSSFSDPRIRYIYQRNLGLAEARNRGLAEATGQYIAFIDADDLWREDKLEKQLLLFDNLKVGFVFSERQDIDINSHFLRLHSGLLHRGSILLPLIKRNFISVSSVMVRRTILSQYGLAFRTGRQGVEDWDLWLRLARVCEADYSADPLLLYRIHSNNMTLNRLMMFESSIKTLMDLEVDLIQENYPGLDKVKLCIEQCRSNLELRFSIWLFLHQKYKDSWRYFKNAFLRDFRCLASIPGGIRNAW